MSVVRPSDAKLTKKQAEGLRRIRDHGVYAWTTGNRAGGATARMFDRMAEAGFCTPAPHKITDKGREALTLLGLRK